MPGLDLNVTASTPAGSTSAGLGDDALRELGARLQQQVARYSEGTFANRPAASIATRGQRYLATDLGIEYLDIGIGWVAAGGATRTLRVPHTFAVPGTIAVPSGSTDYIPPMFVAVPSGQTAKLVACRHMIRGGTSATVTVTRNGATAGTGWSGIVATTAAATTDPADVTLANNDTLGILVTAISGAPDGLSFTLLVEYTA